MTEKPIQKIIAGDRAVLAERYAQALLELAEARNLVGTIEADLAVLSDVIASSAAFGKIAAYPRLPMDKALSVFKMASEKGQLSELTMAFLLQVVRGRRLAYLGDMIAAFRDLLAVRRGEKTAYVSTATALSEAQSAALAAQLGKISGGTVHIVAQENPDLLGGMTIQMGSRLIDASVKGRLAQIERQLKTQQEAA